MVCLKKKILSENVVNFWDLKPISILIRNDGIFKFADIGLSEITEPSECKEYY